MIDPNESRCHFGDAADLLRQLPDKCVQTCVTSPPYWGLRDYGVDGQIGLESSPDAYVARIVEVFREVRRVLKDDGTLFLNLGDSYFGGGRRANAYDKGGKAPASSSGRGCFCQSLCGACREAYRIGKSHNGPSLDPTPPASMTSSSRVRTGSPSVHLPMSDSDGRVDHSAVAMPDRRHSPALVDAQPPSSRASMPDESSTQPREDCRQSGQPSKCQLCERSFADCAPASSRMSACTCGTAGLSSAARTTDTDVSDSAYPYYTTASRLKTKDLVGIPWMVAFALRADGWYLRSDIIWHKPNPMPESVRDRPTKAHEYLFLLSKSERYRYDADAVAEVAVGIGGGGRMKPGVKSFETQHGGCDTSGLGDAGPTRNRRSVWTVTPKPFKGAHFATMPPGLVGPCILAGSGPGDVVLDPFFGSGTTGMVAEQHGRKWIGFDLNPAYEAVQRQRLAR